MQNGLFTHLESIRTAADSSPDQPVATKRCRAIRSPRPGLSVCVLGSGSGGNCSALRLTHAPGQRDTILLDAGFGIRRTTAKLAEAGLAFGDVRAVLLTHLDRDHFKPSLCSALLAHRIPLHCHHWHRDELANLEPARKLFDADLVRPFADGLFLPVPSVFASTTRLQHDRQGTIGYRLSTRFGDLGYATDLGHAPPSLIQHFAGVDILCIEANYDQRMTIHCSRPSFVNRRNLSDSGHLSNEQAYEAVQQIRDASPYGNPRQVVLLHRSQQCNHPMKLRRVFERDPQLIKRVTLTEQRKRTRWISVKPMRRMERMQMTLAS